MTHALFWHAIFNLTGRNGLGLYAPEKQILH